MKNWARFGLCVAILAFAPQLWNQFEAPKAVVVRVVGFGALAAAVASAFALGRATSKPRWLTLDIAMLAWLVTDAAATMVSRAPRLSVFGEVNQYEGLVTSLGLSGFYLSARLAPGARDAERTLSTFLGAMAVSCGYALIQTAGLDPVTWYGTAVYAVGSFLRPFGTLAHPNLLGVLAAAAWSVALTRLLSGRAQRGLWVGAVMLFGLTTLATLSRAAWLALGAGTLAATLGVFLGANRRPPFRRFAWVVFATTLALALLVTNVDVLRSRFFELLSPAAGPSRARLEIWRTTMAMWGAHPWLGVGPDVYGALFQRYQTAEFWRYEWGVSHFHAHSIYLHALATRGVAGFVAGGVVIAALVASLRRGWRHGGAARQTTVSLVAALAAIAVSGAFGALGMAGAAMTATLLGVAAGVANGSSQAPRSDAALPRAATGGAARRAGPPRGAKGPSRLARRPLWIGIGAAATVLGLHVGEFMAWRSAIFAREYMPRRAADVTDPTSLRAADQASARLPDHDQIANLRANVYLAYAVKGVSLEGSSAGASATTLPRGATARWLAEAERSARQAIALVPQRAVNHQTLGAIEIERAKRGDREALTRALEAFRACWAWSPMNALAMLQFAHEAVTLGHPDLAVEPARRAAALYPEEALPAAVLGEAALAIGDSTTAATAFERALGGTWRNMPFTRKDLEAKRSALRPAAPHR